MMLTMVGAMRTQCWNDMKFDHGCSPILQQSNTKGKFMRRPKKQFITKMRKGNACDDNNKANWWQLWQQRKCASVKVQDFRTPGCRHFTTYIPPGRQYHSDCCAVSKLWHWHVTCRLAAQGISPTAENTFTIWQGGWVEGSAILWTFLLFVCSQIFFILTEKCDSEKSSIGYGR